MDARPTRLDAAILAGFALALAAFVGLTWAQWPLLTADSARELYVPFQIRHGALIYRDFYYLYGPVAPYFQAGLLAVFGERLEVLYVAAALHLGAIMGLLYAAARHVLAPWPAAAALFLFFTHFAMGRDLHGYMWPYAFAATYGVLLGLLVLVALLRHHATGSLGWLALAGAAAGLSAVTKLEYGAAACALVGLHLVARLALRPGLAAARPWPLEAAVAVGPAVAVAGGVAAALLAQMPFATIRESAWPTRLMAMWGSKGQWHGDLATWKENVRWLGVAIAPLALIAGHERIVDGVRRSWRWRVGVGAVVAGLVAFAAGKPDRLPYIWEHLHAYWIGPSFAVLVGALAVMGWRLAADRRAGRPVDPVALSWCLIAAYGLLVALRTVFRGLNEYTPYQAPVALIAWVGLAAVWLPGLFGPLRRPRVAGALLVGVMALVGGRQAYDIGAEYAWPSYDLRGPAGLVRADAEFGRPFEAALIHVRGRLRPGEKVVAAPMEPSFYLFLGLDNPVKEDQLFYGYLITPEEQLDFIGRMREANVRFFVLSNFGYKGKEFGVDYMVDLDRWLRTKCRVSGRFYEGLYDLTVYETPWAGLDPAPGAPDRAPGLSVRMPEKPAPGGGKRRSSSGVTPPASMIER